MNLENKVKKEQWEVLQKLKEESYRVLSGDPIQHWVTFGFFGAGVLTADNEIKALEKLEELGAIRIINPRGHWEYE